MRLPSPKTSNRRDVHEGRPYELWIPATEPPWPGMVILHGAGSCKENHADFARSCVARGWAAITYDQRGHGDSEDEMAPAAVGDVGRMARLLAETDGVDPERVCVRGSSMGGFMAIHAAAVSDRIAGVIAICPASEENLLDGLRRERFEMRVDRDALEAWLGEHDVADAVALVGSKPILFLHAQGDEQIDCAQTEALAAARGAAGRGDHRPGRPPPLAPARRRAPRGRPALAREGAALGVLTEQAVDPVLHVVDVPAEVVAGDALEHVVDGARDRLCRVAEAGVEAGRPLHGLIDVRDGVVDGVRRRGAAAPGRGRGTSVAVAEPPPGAPGVPGAPGAPASRHPGRLPPQRRRVRGRRERRRLPRGRGRPVPRRRPRAGRRPRPRSRRRRPGPSIETVSAPSSPDPIGTPSKATKAVTEMKRDQRGEQQRAACPGSCQITPHDTPGHAPCIHASRLRRLTNMR